ncbi:MAG: hypothetical protein ACFB10_05045 [Salibacteraceae bacterium]
MSKLLLPIFFVVFCGCFLSFTKKEAVVFRKDGVEITVPSKWKISKEAEHPEGYFVSFERKGFGSSGLVTLRWFNNQKDLKSMASNHREQLIGAYQRLKANPQMGLVSRGLFKEHPTQEFTYSMSLIGVGHRGGSYFFNACGKTFNITYQGADEDAAKNEEGLTSIPQSFRCQASN